MRAQHGNTSRQRADSAPTSSGRMCVALLRALGQVRARDSVTLRRSCARVEHAGVLVVFQGEPCGSLC